MKFRLTLILSIVFIGTVKAQFSYDNSKINTIEWVTSNGKGIIECNIEPLSKGITKIKLDNLSSDITINIKSINDTYLVESYHFDLKSIPSIKLQNKNNKIRTKNGLNEIVISNRDLTFTVDKVKGKLTVSNKNGNYILINFPELLLLPITG
jgi:hypothetical protein